MSTRGRPGCSYCFKSIDSPELREGHRKAVSCTRCQSVFHLDCWNLASNCLLCSNDQYQAFQPPASVPPIVVTKTQVLPIQAASLAYSIGGFGVVVPDYLYRQILLSAQDDERAASRKQDTTGLPWYKRVQIQSGELVRRALPVAIEIAALTIAVIALTARVIFRILYQVTVQIIRWISDLVAQIDKAR